MASASRRGKQRGGRAAAPARAIPPALIEAACVLLALAALHPLMGSGPLWGHDTGAHVFRLAELARALRDGVIYPRFIPDAYGGLGGPILNFNPVAPYYIPALLVLAGIGPIGALKISAGLLMIAGGFAMRILARPHLGRAGAAVAGLAYVYFPYRIANLYVRMAYSELAAMVLLPLAMAAARRAARRPTLKRTAVAAVAAALLPATHFPSTVLGFPVIVLYAAWSMKRGHRLRGAAAVGAAIGLALMLAAFCWLPALVEIRGTHYQESTRGYDNYLNHFVVFEQLLSPRWGFGASLPGARDQMSFQMGWVHLLGWILLAGVGLFRVGRARRLASFCTLIVAGGAFMMLRVSEPLWRLAPILQNVQFPWRFLMLTGIGSSLALGFAAVLPPILAASGDVGAGKAPRGLREGSEPSRARRADRVVLSGVAALVMGACLPYLQARPWKATDADFTPEALRSRYYGELKFQPEEVRTLQFMPGGPRAQVIQGGSARIVDEATQRMTVEVDALGPATLRLHLFDSPGWAASISGRPARVRREPQTGLVLVDVPAGRSRVDLRFGDTPVRRLGWLLAAAGLAACAGLVFADRLRRAGRVDSAQTSP